MKKFVLAAAIASTFSGLAATPAFAEVSVSGNVSLVTDYRFRGVSQTEEKPALQGGFDVDFGNGFYLGNWNSSLGGVGYANYSGLESDIYGGFAGEVGAVSYDIGVLQYIYPKENGATDLDTTEIYGSLGYMGFTLGGAVSTSDLFGINNSDGSTYVYLNYDYEFSNGLGLGLHYGATDISGAGNTGDYDDWSIGLTYSVGKFDFGLAYVDTDLKGPFATFDGGATGVFSVGTSF